MGGTLVGCFSCNLGGGGVSPGVADLQSLRVLKGSVQRDVTGIEIGLKKSVLKSNITGKMSF